VQRRQAGSGASGSRVQAAELAPGRQQQRVHGR
jgi:hypothetical protein